jgi:predicted nucleic acid-binding protein
VILVDSSVWIEVLRERTTRETELLERLSVDEGIAIADLCVFEVLQGVRPGADFVKAHETLREFSIVSVGGEAIAVAAARNAQLLRSKGFQATAIDCLLATYCIMNGLRFLTADKDFEAFAAHLGLDLVR